MPNEKKILATRRKKGDKILLDLPNGENVEIILHEINPRNVVLIFLINDDIKIMFRGQNEKHNDRDNVV